MTVDSRTNISHGSHVDYEQAMNQLHGSRSVLALDYLLLSTSLNGDKNCKN
jgi:hypothetical protein